MYKHIEWVFFDLDGTLIDSIPAMYRVYCSILESYNIKGSKQEFEELNGPSLPEVIEILNKRHCLNPPIDISGYKQRILNAYQNHVAIREGSVEVLSRLKAKGYKLFMVTSAQTELAMELIRTQNWDKYFSDFMFGDQVEKSKPDPEIYNLALAKSGASPCSVMVIEDSPNGIKASYDAGLAVIGINDTYPKEKLMDLGACSVISSLYELITILEA